MPEPPGARARPPPPEARAEGRAEGGAARAASGRRTGAEPSAAAREAVECGHWVWALVWQTCETWAAPEAPRESAATAGQARGVSTRTQCANVQTYQSENKRDVLRPAYIRRGPQGSY